MRTNGRPRAPARPAGGHTTGLAAAIGLALLVAGRPADTWAAEVTVRAHTMLSLDVHTVGRHVELDGTLRDNLFQGLAQRPLQLTLTPAGHGASGRPQERPLTTDRNGHLSWADWLDDGDWRAQVHFAGDAWLADAQAEVSFSVVREQARMTLGAPVAAPTWADLPVEVSLLGAADAIAGRSIHLRMNGRLVATDLVTDESGEARTELRDLPFAGRGRLEARFPGDDVLAPVSAHKEVLLYHHADLFLDTQVEERRDGRFLVVAGRLSTDVGPIAAADVSLEIDDVGPPIALRTDDQGGFEQVEPIDGLDPGSHHRLVGWFDPHGTPEPDLRVGGEAPFDVPPSPLASAGRLGGVAALLLLVGLGIGLLVVRLAQGLRLRRERRAGVPPPGRLAPEGLVDLAPVRPGRRAEERRVSGTVRDADTGRPIEGGNVEVALAESTHVFPIATDGSFSTAPLPDGPARVTVRVSGYAATHFEAPIPHNGRFSGVEVHVCSVRVWVRYLYQTLTLQLDLDDDGEVRWGRATPRQIEALLVAAVASLRAAEGDAAGEQAFREQLREILEDPELVAADRVLRALTLLVEEVYYSGRLYEETMIGLCRSLIAGVQEAVQGAAATEGTW